MFIYNVILQNSDASYENALSIVRDGSLLIEAGAIETESPPLHAKPEGKPVNGVQIWYDYGADYYFFEDVEEA